MTDDLLDFVGFAPTTTTVHVDVEREDGVTLLTLYIRLPASPWTAYPMVFRDGDADDIGIAVETQIRAHHASSRKRAI